VLLDRDGVINVDHGYVSRPEEFEFVPGVLEFLRAAQAQGFLLVVITNQSGIARGYFNQRQYAALEEHMRVRLCAEGIDLAAVYVCPHHPDGSVPEFTIHCDCRKPKPGLILRAARDLHLDLKRSILVGDKESDIEAAHRAGVGKAFLLDISTSDSLFSAPFAAIFQ
jgi:D-glycero-D-manno-heptose 1,7-bisphosphate phosphatase